MNFTTFVFSLLIILSFGTFAAIEKQTSNRRIRSTYLGHLQASRKILSQCETEIYRSFHSIPKQEKEPPQSHPKSPSSAPEIPKINPACARLNLWPLIQEGREAHPLLYETAAKLFKTFYGATLFEKKARAEYRFLDHFLQKAKENPEALEKLVLNPAYQSIYYRMLKGTKQWNLETGVGYPSLLDALTIEETPSKICLSHAHPDQMAVFFGPKVAAKLFAAVHQKEAPPLTKELIEKICSENHITALDPALFDLFELGRPRHPKRSKTTLIAEDSETHISLRKNVYLPRS